ncbi:MAG: FGGY-family carbohydrate kinase [Phycisphaerales bacterium]|nr:FGGY-family carbohydrate kinase [Phycisphaerales bacterium]
MTAEAPVFVGVDVGTGSARAGVFDAEGRMLGSAAHPIRMWRPQTDFVEQSSDDIWQACCTAVKDAMRLAGASADRVAGVGFDATCSLVALDENDRPVTVSPSGHDEQNVIVWLDHRAIEQAERINAMGHNVLRYVGKRISPEMESPKLLWLMENLRQTWLRAVRYFDLPDFLTYRATGCEGRSLCSTVCKWTYLGHEPSDAADSLGRWDATYWKAIGLGDLAADGFKRIGTRIRPPGEAMGTGLTEKAAGELGLKPGTSVGVSIIDAHAGGLGLLGAPLEGKHPTPADMEHRLALIGGTSTCHMAVSRRAHFIDGVWGPYFGAMIPDMWLTEGGQSATGALIDHIIFSHARAAELQREANDARKSVYEILNGHLERLAAGSDLPAQLTRDLHVMPDFHGNRSPRADATLRGMISGLRLSDSIDDLALLYLATVQAVAHGTRHIVDTLNGSGYRVDTMFACGGGTKNPVFLREHADVTGLRIVLPREPEAILLGSAILGAVASGRFATVLDAMAAMNHADRIIEPSGGSVRAFHDAKHRVFHRMYEDQLAYRALMR